MPITVNREANRCCQGPRAPGKDKQALPFDCKAGRPQIRHLIEQEIHIKYYKIMYSKKKFAFTLNQVVRFRRGNPVEMNLWISSCSLISCQDPQTSGKSNLKSINAAHAATQVEMVADRRQVQGDDSIKKGAGGFLSKSNAANKSFPNRVLNLSATRQPLIKSPPSTSCSYHLS